MCLNWAKQFYPAGQKKSAPHHQMNTKKKEKRKQQAHRLTLSARSVKGCGFNSLASDFSVFSFASSRCVCMDSFLVLRLPPTVQQHICEASWRLSIATRCGMGAPADLCDPALGNKWAQDKE